jgi:hypothetical protein
LYMVCCVFKAPNLVNNYQPRKPASLPAAGRDFRK